MFTIDPIFAQGSSLQFERAVNSAIGYFEQHIQNNMTISIEFAQQPISANAVAQTSAAYDNTEFTYSQIKSAILSHITDPIQAIAASFLPQTSPFGSSLFQISNAEAAALNLPTNYSPNEKYNGQNIDGVVTLNSIYSYSYTHTNVQPNQFDAVGTLEHEISEVLGRLEYQLQGGLQTVDRRPPHFHCARPDRFYAPDPVEFRALFLNIWGNIEHGIHRRPI